MDIRRRVVVTGLGAASPLGETVRDFWNGLINGISGIGPMTLCDPTDYPCRISGEVTGFDPDNYLERKESRRMARFSQLAIAASQEALAHASLLPSNLDPDRIGVLLGNGNGGFPTIEENSRILASKGGMRMSPFFFPMILPNMAAANVSRLFGAKGYNSTVTTACAAGTQAIGEATEVIRQGRADAMITGGTEGGISQLGLAGFAVMRALSTQRNDAPSSASRPFDLNRDGFVPAEGAGILIIESLDHAVNRGATVLGEITGFGCSSDAFHQFQPEESGEGAARAITLALADAGISPEQVSYVNAHGTSTPLNDYVETMAIKLAFGEHASKIPISSTKSMIGHSLGAAGGLEGVVAVQSLLAQAIHPTINLDDSDPACDLDYVPNVGRKLRLQHVLSNSFGFGGQNACIIVSEFEK